MMTSLFDERYLIAMNFVASSQISSDLPPSCGRLYGSISQLLVLQGLICILVHIDDSIEPGLRERSEVGYDSTSLLTRLPPILVYSNKRFFCQTKKAAEMER